MTTAAKTAGSDDPSLVVSAVTKSFDHKKHRVDVLCGVDLGVQRGEFVCLYGVSGSGKTTLLHLVAGLETPDSGLVRFEGHDVGNASENERARLRLQRIGVVFQRDNLISELCAWENVALPLLGLGRSRAEAREQALAALELVGIGSLADRSPEQLSGGERQRVGIARGIVGDRTLLVADEPTGALDTRTSRLLFDLLRELATSARRAVVVATHDPLALDYASRAVTLQDGRLDAA